MKWFILGSFLLLSKGVVAQSGSDSSEQWSCHFQFTGINQRHPAFSAAYSGKNSLINADERKALSITATLFAGRRLWKNAAIYGDAEIAGGTGISAARGIAGFPNGETFRIGDPSPSLYLARAYLQQHFPVGPSRYEYIAGGPNELSGKIPASRITVTAGIFSLADFFDGNEYSHDPRTQFLNWALMSNGAWDYPANTRGYTRGVVAELVQPGWALRVSSVLVPKKANGLDMDYKVSKAHSETIEVEKSWSRERAGSVRLLFFRNVSQAPRYATTLANVAVGDSTSVDVYTGVKEWQRYGGVKYGFGINAAQQLSSAVGAFFRAGWNDGRTATWAFTEIDRTVSAGLSATGTKWKRPGDIAGVAVVVNGLSADHRRFLSSGLYGFIIGDGRLNYGAEAIAEAYYQARLLPAVFFTADYQFVQHPAYNKDRGPVHIFAIRGHVEF